MNEAQYSSTFAKLTGNPPFPWQWKLYQDKFALGDFPSACSIPTGLGKTSVVAIWLIALATGPAGKVPRRLVYVVNRRTVVDQTTNEVEKLRTNLDLPELSELKTSLRSLALSTLRGQFADNREWSANPSRPAVICGTVDMIGSRLLFSGYGVGFKGRPLHAGFLGQDVLLVHDEAHLEPAFQRLIEAIRDEQKREPAPLGEQMRLKVMALSATSRTEGGVFELTQDETEPREIPNPPTQPIHFVWRRLTARKGICFHAAPRDAVAKKIGEMARDRWKTSEQAVLVFVRTVEDVRTVQHLLTDKKVGVPEAQVQILTGTLRGLERDRLATEDPVFARFMPDPKVTPKEGTVYLVCTSAGEVGVDISANHMVCDLTTLDSMAQRLGRVNRRGGDSAEIDIYYETDRNPKPPSPQLESARWKTKEILERLPKCSWIDDRRDGSPLALRRLSFTAEERKAAFAPEPTYLDTSDILFDAWALTTIRGKLPGRPPVEEYLHGTTDYDPPQTTVAWREEVEKLTEEVLGQNRLKIEDVLEAYPLKPHEELSGPTYGKNKVFEQLEKIAARDKEREPNKRLFAWVIDPDGSAARYSLTDLVNKDIQNRPLVLLGGRTVILPPHAGGLGQGQLKGDEPFVETAAYDVSEKWFADAARTILRRRRVWGDDEQLNEKTKQMRPILRIDFPSPEDEADAEGRSWYWFTRPKSADDDGSKNARDPIPWQRHTADVTAHTQRIAAVLLENEVELRAALVLAARLHDLGKRRVVWQRSIGNPHPTQWYAKSAKNWRTREITDYRHEFGSLLDLENDSDFKKLGDPMKDLVRHVVTAHHGYGRPHFPEDQAFDPAPPEGVDPNEIASEIPRRFAQLQRKYGRWGLAYLESLLRAADWAASAEASQVAGDAS